MIMMKLNYSNQYKNKYNTQKILSIVIYFYMVDNKIKYVKVMNTRKYIEQIQNIMLIINNS